MLRTPSATAQLCPVQSVSFAAVLVPCSTAAFIHFSWSLTPAGPQHDIFLARLITKSGDERVVTLNG